MDNDCDGDVDGDDADCEEPGDDDTGDDDTGDDDTDDDDNDADDDDSTGGEGGDCACRSDGAGTGPAGAAPLAGLLALWAALRRRSA